MNLQYALSELHSAGRVMAEARDNPNVVDTLRRRIEAHSHIDNVLSEVSTAPKSASRDFAEALLVSMRGLSGAFIVATSVGGNGDRLSAMAAAFITNSVTVEGSIRAIAAPPFATEGAP